MIQFSQPIDTLPLLQFVFAYFSKVAINANVYLDCLGSLAQMKSAHHVPRLL